MRVSWCVVRWILATSFRPAGQERLPACRQALRNPPRQHVPTVVGHNEKQGASAKMTVK